MLLAILAVLLHTSAYAIYFTQVYGGSSVPNPSSWTIWAFAAVLNALTFWKGTKDALTTAQFFAGSACSVAVWVYALGAGRFSPIDTMGWVVLVLCVIACIVWQLKKSAAYANLVITAIFAVSSYPTIAGVWHDGMLERSLPWYLWTAAAIPTMINVIRRRKTRRWWLMLALPIALTIIHGTVAFLARG